MSLLREIFFAMYHKVGIPSCIETLLVGTLDKLQDVCSVHLRMPTEALYRPIYMYGCKVVIFTRFTAKDVMQAREKTRERVATIIATEHTHRVTFCVKHTIEHTSV